MKTDQRDESSARVTSAFHSIVFSGLAVGVLDSLAATTNAWFRGVGPTRVWQYVASSLVGSESYERGATTVVIGLLIHFGVAFGVATTFYLLARIFPMFIRHAVVSGMIYGVVVFFAM